MFYILTIQLDVDESYSREEKIADWYSHLKSYLCTLPHLIRRFYWQIIHNCGIMSKIKNVFMCCLDNWRASKGLSVSFPTHNATAQIWFSSQITLLIKGTKHISCLQLSIRFLFPASPQKYSNKPIVSLLLYWRHLTFMNLQNSCSRPQHLVVHSVPECNTRGGYEQHVGVIFSRLYL